MLQIPKLILVVLTMLLVVVGCKKKAADVATKGDEQSFVDPYYEGHDSTKFDPHQVDFSKEYLDLRTKIVAARSLDVTPIMGDYIFDTDSIFCTDHFDQNGVLGTDYRRIRMYVSKARQESFDSLVFAIEGKSNVGGTICNFKGKVQVLSVYEYFDEPDYPGQAVLFARYKLAEDASQTHPGVFEGILEVAVKIDRPNKVVRLDTSFSLADDYHNRTYVGTWKSYDKLMVKKCIWGDYRLPFTFGFDCGDGEMMVCARYVKNGWQSYNDGSDYAVNSLGDYRLHNQWWKK